MWQIRIVTWLVLVLVGASFLAIGVSRLIHGSNPFYPLGLGIAALALAGGILAFSGRRLFRRHQSGPLWGRTEWGCLVAIAIILVLLAVGYVILGAGALAIPF